MKIKSLLVALGVGLGVTLNVMAASQDKYTLPDRYLVNEKAYLAEYPQLQKVMDVMIAETEKQLAKPQNDILHNRVCTVLVYQMAKDGKLSKEDTYLAVAGDLLHNITKNDKTRVLTDPKIVEGIDAVVKKLRAAGYLKNSPKFWTDTSIFANPKLGNNLGQMHHLSGSLFAGQLLEQIGFAPKDVTKLEASIIEHSTGYWYFRSAVSKTLGNPEGWALVYPTPENKLADYIHDADLISQFVYESVVPAGSKWRNLATKRWGAKPTPEDEGYVVYYVFQKLFDEARTPMGKALAKEEWDKIAPELKKLMNLKPEDDPIKLKGTPEAFK
jgi:hypothetical protein